MGGKPPVVNPLFFGFAKKNRVLTGLTHSADPVFLDAKSVTELGCRFAADDASATSESQGAGPPEVFERDIVEVGVHVFSFHAISIRRTWTFVHRFF